MRHYHCIQPACLDTNAAPVLGRQMENNCQLSFLNYLNCEHQILLLPVKDQSVLTCLTWKMHVDTKPLNSMHGQQQGWVHLFKVLIRSWRACHVVLLVGYCWCCRLQGSIIKVFCVVKRAIYKAVTPHRGELTHLPCSSGQFTKAKRGPYRQLSKTMCQTGFPLLFCLTPNDSPLPNSLLWEGLSTEEASVCPNFWLAPCNRKQCEIHLMSVSFLPSQPGYTNINLYERSTS